MKIATWQADAVDIQELVPDSTSDWVYGIILFSQGASALKSRIGSELRGPKWDPDADSTEMAGKMVVILEETSDLVVIILEQDEVRR